jgi:hypothetical protein
MAPPQHQPSAPANGAETGAEWPTLLGRMLEDLSHVIQLELQLLEARIAPALTAMVDRALAGLVILCAGVIGGSCLLAALVLLLHERMQIQWWECMAIGGIVAIACGLLAYMSVKSSAAHG